MSIDFPTALGFSVAFFTAVLAFFSVLVAYFLGRNVYKYRTELDELGSRLEKRQSSFESMFQDNSYILSKLELALELIQSQDSLIHARQEVEDFFSECEVDEETVALIQSKIQYFERKLTIRQQEMRLLSLGLQEGRAILNGLVIHSGDLETVNFLKSMLVMYDNQEHKEILNQSIGRIMQRLHS